MGKTLIQLRNREEWLEHRLKYIGGSEASAVLGLNPYMTNQELWEIKTGLREQEDITEKPYVQYGVQAEDYLRKLFQLDYPQYSVSYMQNNSYLNDDVPWAAASLDGTILDQDGRLGILEIKTTNILQSMQKEKWNHRIPDNYYTQILHYLMVTGFEFAVLKAQLKSEFEGEIYLQTRHYHIERADVAEDIEYLAQQEQKFWECVKNNERPALVLPEI